jgi:hypothetical protein
MVLRAAWKKKVRPYVKNTQHKKGLVLALVAHACNPNYSGGLQFEASPGK